MGNVVSSVFGGGSGGGLFGIVGSLVGGIFGPLGSVIGGAIGGLVDQMFSGAMNNNNVDQNTQDQAKEAYRSSFNQASGGLDPTDAGRGSMRDQIDQFASAANASPADRGHLQQLADQLEKAINDAVAQASSDAAGGGSEAKENKKGGSWIVALARALGQTAGKSAANLVQLSDKLQKAGDDKIAAAGGKDEKAKESAAVAYNEANVEFQGASQEFNMLMTTISTTLKSLGEAMSQVARKQ